MANVKLAEKSDLPFLLAQLRRDPVRNAYAIQDLLVWFDASKLWFSGEGAGFSYVLRTGHPASAGRTTLVANGDPSSVTEILRHAAVPAPFVLRESPASLRAAVESVCPGVKVYEEQRMDVTASTFTPKHSGRARSLTVADAPKLAAFFGAPPQAAKGFEGWLGGACAFFGVLEGERLVSIGSSMVAVPEAWNIVSIETHKDFRGKGYATELVSALVERALRDTSTVTLTVVKGNEPAIKAYEKVGFRHAEDRIWVDNGANSAP